jgi:ATP-dependent RNA helicase SUPV3L1/SUV3
MLNLLGCNKDNFKKLLLNMGYRVIEKNDEVFFKYRPRKNNKKIYDKKISKESPFGILKNLNLN